MKFLAFFVMLAAHVATSWSSKHPDCNLPHAYEGGIACRAYVPSWTYNSATQECLNFIYGGCGGNDNRFPTKELCEAKCK